MTIKSSNRFGIRVALIALCALAPVTAFAQWEVVDNAANTKLENLDKIRNQNLIGAKEKKDRASGEEVEKPKEKLVKRKDDEGVSQCAKATSGTSVASEQQKTCEIITRTRNSQYNYMVAMYDITDKRLGRLREIERARQSIKPEEIGKLEDNTNKLIALKTLMDIDRQQTEAAMFAYEKRLAFLNDVQSAGARAAMNGQKPPSADQTQAGGLFPGWDGLGDIASKMIGGAVMTGALETAKSSKPDGFQKLNID
ncbi:hypothetical protein ISN34_14545 [Xanthomonas translucens pv. translucens]|uniref:Type IV secretion system protein VirB5 n=4 Tax=Xanthomonas campestris pv. translucens TaxID=343 RepID=A0A109HRY2_XANCT|nr:hypothetical protein [Xanthomonas translucens]KWV17200.1 hypothetical protein ATB53_00515 [Xanthomonas translucens]QSQ35947.1 hypothetical protein ISN31_03190 [Xanthomonas translucens pv. translucens]QSQ44460.1 hypothetical protein ISN34_14545 [Xanthomonas translucens pv. translucens]